MNWVLILIVFVFLYVSASAALVWFFRPFKQKEEKQKQEKRKEETHFSCHSHDFNCVNVITGSKSKWNHHDISICIYIYIYCMYVCTYGCMDGWMDGWMHNICMCIVHYLVSLPQDRPSYVWVPIVCFSHPDRQMKSWFSFCLHSKNTIFLIHIVLSRFDWKFLARLWFSFCSHTRSCSILPWKLTNCVWKCSGWCNPLLRHTIALSSSTTCLTHNPPCEWTTRYISSWRV